MSLESQQEKIERYIDDAIALEAASILALKDMAANSISPEETLLYQAHHTESELQKQRLETRLTALGGASERLGLKDMMNRIGAAATNLLHAGKNDAEKDTRNLLQAYAMESLEMAVYEALYTAAENSGDTETALLAREIQAEESVMAQHIFERIAPSSTVSMQAAG